MKPARPSTIGSLLSRAGMRATSTWEDGYRTHSDYMGRTIVRYYPEVWKLKRDPNASLVGLDTAEQLLLSKGYHVERFTDGNGTLVLVVSEPTTISN